MTGHTDPFWPQLALPLAAALPPSGERRQFVRGMLSSGEFGALDVMPISEMDSSHSSSLAAADALIVQPENDPGMGAGSIVQVIPLSWG
jgi:molybdopterin molybdotransferase